MKNHLTIHLNNWLLLQNKIFFCILSIFILIDTPVMGQNPTTPMPGNQHLIEVAREIIAHAGTCALITVDNKNRPRVRMVETLPVDSSFTFWFGTNPRSRKVNQIMNNEHVSIYYTEAYSTGYVMVEGIASIITDSTSKSTHWKEGWQSFYPDKKHDFVLIKVVPNWLEIVSYTHGIVGKQDNWEPPRVVFHR